MKTITTLAYAGLVLAAGLNQAEAHVSFTSPTVTEDGTSVVSLQVPHGCDGKTTTELRVKLPQGFVFAKPQPKPGWNLEIIQGSYGKTYDNYGEKADSGPVEIRWKGGELPDAFYDTFSIRGKISGVPAGQSLAFPTTQICGTEAEVAWSEIAPEGGDAHALKSPAPILTVAAKPVKGQDEHMGMAMKASASAPADLPAEAVRAGDLEISGGYTKAMLPGQPVGGGYLTIKNNGKTDDVLVSASSPVAGAVEIHEMAMQGQVMKMRKLEGGLPIGAGQSVALAPGGFHLMFLRLQAPFREGTTVPLTLTFKTAGKVDVTLQVKPAASAAQGQN